MRMSYCPVFSGKNKPSKLVGGPKSVKAANTTAEVAPGSDESIGNRRSRRHRLRGRPRIGRLGPGCVAGRAADYSIHILGRRGGRAVSRSNFADAAPAGLRDEQHVATD